MTKTGLMEISPIIRTICKILKASEHISWVKDSENIQAWYSTNGEVKSVSRKSAVWYVSLASYSPEKIHVSLIGKYKMVLLHSS